MDMAMAFVRGQASKLHALLCSVEQGPKQEMIARQSMEKGGRREGQVLNGNQELDCCYCRCIRD